MKNKIIAQYYTLNGLLSFGGLSMVTAIYVSFLLKHGLSLLEANLVNACYFASLFLLEIPTGAFADLFGRKTSFILACVCIAASNLIYGLSSTLPGFIVAEVVAAIGVTCYNGAFQAWFVDSMKHYGDHGPHTKKFAVGGLICQACAALGCITGSNLSALHPLAPWATSAVILTGMAIYAYVVLDESYFVRHEFSFAKGLAAMKDTASKSIRYALHDKAVRFVLIVTFVQILAVQPLNMYWQPRMRDVGISEQNYGFVFASVLVMLAIGSYVVSKIGPVGRERKLVLASQILTGVLVLALACVGTSWAVVALFLVHEIPRGMWSPLREGYLQDKIPSSERATISSFCSMAPHVGGVIGLVGSGLIADRFGIQAAWFVAAGILIVGSLVIMRNGRS